MDVIHLSGLQINTVALSPAPWEAALHKPQPLLLDIQIQTSVQQAALTDNLNYSINYAGIADALIKHFADPSYLQNPENRNAHSIAELCATIILFEFGLANDSDRLSISIHQPEALLYAKGYFAHICRSKCDYTGQILQSKSANALEDKLEIRQAPIESILGLYGFERTVPQPLLVTATIWPAHNKMAWCAQQLQLALREHVLRTNPLLIESLCSSLSSHLAATCKISRVRVKIEKPKAVMWASAPAVELERRYPAFIQRRLSSSIRNTRHSHTAFVAIGSNVGDRASHIASAIRHLSQPSSINQTDAASSLLETSFLYESEPMYVVDQARFLNGVCKISTDLSPQELLKWLKTIESHIGRRKTIEKGPREIDLDLLLYDQDAILRDTEVDLTIPHPAISEREFVLRPLSDIAPSFTHPQLQLTTTSLLTTLMSRSTSSPLHKVIPLTPSTLSLDPSQPTLLMAILNVTPDSFSDGGDSYSLQSALQNAKQLIADGADILDIGGMSTRPGAADVSLEEELKRVIPVIEALRRDGVTIPISIDTFRSEVAQKAVEAGANIVNDVSGGTLDPEMFSTVAKLGCPYVLMHMRGSPATMTGLTKYENGNVVAGVRAELEGRVKLAMEAGIARWNIIIDPGVGFAKDTSGNLALLKNLPQLTTSSSILQGMPVLVGASRKKFLGRVIGRPDGDAKEREYAHAAACTVAISGGARILRVHDVKASKDAAKLADSIYRQT